MQRSQLARHSADLRGSQGKRRRSREVVRRLCVVLAAFALWAAVPIVAGSQEGEELLPAEEFPEEAAPPTGLSFRFGDAVSAPDRRFIERAAAWTYEYWGPDAGPVTVYVYPELEELLASYAADCICVPSEQRRNLGQRFHTSSPGALLVLASSQGPWAKETEGARLDQLLHSQFHAIQGYWSFGRVEPAWMVEGGAVYSVNRILAANGKLNYEAYEAERRGLIDEARGMVVRLSELEGLQDTKASPWLDQAAHVLGLLAVEHLASLYGEGKLMDYWKAYRDALRAGSEHDKIARSSWTQAFEDTFGLSLEDFYQEFELYRATL